MKRLFGFVLSVAFLALTLGGCACWQKEVKSEPAAPERVVERAPQPEPYKPMPPKKDRN
jgi:hypothetical protein